MRALWLNFWKISVSFIMAFSYLQNHQRSWDPKQSLCLLILLWMPALRKPFKVAKKWVLFSLSPSLFQKLASTLLPLKHYAQFVVISFKAHYYLLLLLLLYYIKQRGEKKGHCFCGYIKVCTKAAWRIGGGLLRCTFSFAISMTYINVGQSRKCH